MVRIDLQARRHFLLMYVPIFLIALQSFFKSSVMSFFTQVNLPEEFFYWIVRVALALFFLLILFKGKDWKASAPTRPFDLFKDLRSAADPLLALRAVACLNVFFGHWFLVTFGPHIPPLSISEHFFRVLVSFSPWCGVWIFFSLSGYLMGKGFVTGRHSLSRTGVKIFYFNRVLRIFPIYFTSIFLVAVLVSPASIDLRSLTGWSTILSALLFDQQDNGVIGALWSVSTEFQFYLCAPFVFYALSYLFARVRVLVLVVAILMMAMVFAKYWIVIHYPLMWHQWVYYPLIMNMDCFVAGMSTSIIVNEGLKREFYIKYGVFFGLLLGAVFQLTLSLWSFHEMASFPGYPGSATRPFYLSIAPAVTSLFTCVLIFLFELSNRKAIRCAMFWKISSLLGTLTYCFYVFHEPVILSIRRLFPEDITIYQAAKILPFGFVLVFMVAYLFYYFVETKFDKIRH